jgi:acyl-CoA thioesterase I
MSEFIMFQKSIVIMLLTMGTLCSCSNSSDSSLQNGEAELLNQSSPLQQNEKSKPSPIENHKILLIVGDSLSAAYGMTADKGWVSLLEQRLVEKKYAYQVVNASISGDTTSGGVNRLSNAVKQHNPQIVVLELGANDGLRALSLKKMRQNLAMMIEKSQQVGAKVLLLGMRIPPNYGKDYADGFHQIYHDLAAEYDIPLVPFFLDGVALNSALIQADGLHPNAKAQGRLLDNVWGELEKLL